MSRSIGIVSLKGGVGKTSVTAALGDAFAALGKKTLLVDGNLSAPNLGMHFNIIEPEISLHHILARKARPSDAIHKLDKFDLIPASVFGRHEVSPLKLKDKISSLRKDYDVILLDSSPSLNDETLGVMLASDGILVVTTPDHPTLSNTLKAVKLAMQRGTPIVGLVLNKVYNKDFELSLKDIENTIEIPVMAVIPHDTNFLRAVSEFTTPLSLRPNSGISEEFKRLAATLIGEKYKPVGVRGLFNWISPSVQEINRQIYYDEVFR